MASSPVSIKALWYCSQNRLPFEKSLPLPDEIYLNFTVAKDWSSFEQEGLSDHIKKASVGQLDYFDCMKSFVDNRLSYTLGNKCNKLKLENCVSKITQLLSPLKTMVKKYGIEAEAKGARVPFISFSPDKQDSYMLSNKNWKYYISFSYLTNEHMVNNQLQQKYLVSWIEKNRKKNGNNILNSILLKLQRMQIPSCFKQSPRNEMCQYIIQNTQNILQLLSQIEWDEAVMTRIKQLSRMLNENGVIDIKEFSRVLPELETIAKMETSCVELNVGESKEIWGNMGSGLSSTYNLYRQTEDEYEVDISIKWKNDPENILMKRVDECLPEINKYLASSEDGKKIRLKVIAIDTLSKKVRFNEIELVKAGARSNSSHWASDVGCGTVGHELLHLTGLIDLYTERASKIMVNPNDEKSEYSLSPQEDEATLFDCRNNGKYEKESIMNNHWLARAAVKETLAWEEVNCKKIGSEGYTTWKNREIQKIKSENPIIQKDNKFVGCSDGWVELSKQDVVARKERYKKKVDLLSQLETKKKISKKVPFLSGLSPSEISAAQEEVYKIYDQIDTIDNATPYVVNNVLLVRQAPRQYGVLGKSEINAIIYPGCTKYNLKYYQCSQGAYSTSRQNYGSGCPRFVPEYCQSPSQWLD